MGGRAGLAAASHWPAAGLSGSKGLDTVLDKREALNVDSIDYRPCRALSTATAPYRATWHFDDPRRLINTFMSSQYFIAVFINQITILH